MAQPDFAGDVVGDDGGLVVARTAGLADGQVDRVADHVHVLQAVHLHGLVVGGQPAFVVRRLRSAGFQHGVDRADRRRGHEDVERLLDAFFRIGDALVGIDLREGEAALEPDAALFEDGRQHLARGLLQEQAVAQQLRGGRVGVDDLDPVAHAAAAQVVVEHQRGFDRRDAALVRHIGRLGKGDADEYAPAFDRGQAAGQLPRRLVLVEMVARLAQALDALGRGNATGGDDEIVVAMALAAARVQLLGVEIEARHLVDAELDFRPQQGTFGALELFLEEQVERHIHEGRFVVMIRRIGQQHDADLAGRHFGIQLVDQLVGQHGAADPATHDNNSLAHKNPPMRIIRNQVQLRPYM
ncbi:Uncharacterised protein [Achromobacter sp. 2789STDY5608615]|nr:Uncharacterised protein [Achromobacter sp. 2789STDY5608615]